MRDVRERVRTSHVRVDVREHVVHVVQRRNPMLHVRYSAGADPRNPMLPGAVHALVRVSVRERVRVGQLLQRELHEHC